MSVNIQTIKDIKPFLHSMLGDLYPDTEINAIANIIIKTLFGISKLQAMILPETKISGSKRKEIMGICNELRKGKPLQYVLGETSFYNCTIKVNSSTLIPRPETEELVDLIIKENKGMKPVILDIATGSGCIAIVLAVNLPGSKISAFDISPEALLIAEENARLNKVDVSFFSADIFSKSVPVKEPFDIIVCNPPYVLESEKKLMAVNVLGYEPHSALFVPDDDPLRYYKAVLGIAEKSLKNKGRIYFEINERMGRQGSRLLMEAGYSEIEVVKDINGRDRILKATKNG